MGMSRRDFLNGTGTGAAVAAAVGVDVAPVEGAARDLKTKGAQEVQSEIKEVSKMALVVATFDLPPAEKMEIFREKGRAWVATVLKMPGIKEFRAYRNIYFASPHVMLHEEFDSLESCVKFIKTPEYYAHITDMRALGLSNLSLQMWEAAPDMPGPLRPSRG